MSARAPRHASLAEVMRAGLVESVHYGSAVAVRPDGTVQHAVGDPAAVHYPRSALKPVQAVAMVRAGLDLPSELLALAASSHSGEDFHLAGVRRVLGTAGLSESDLRNPISYPLEERVRHEWLAAGRTPDHLAQNCSGKHSAMLATAKINGWSLPDYLDPDHPLQKEIARTVEDLSGESVAHVAVDGCGAPLFALSLTGLARALGRIASASRGSAEWLVAEAIREHPEMLGGTERPVTELITAVPGLIAKDGFEGVQVAALPDGSSCALKVSDGSARPRAAVTAALLAELGVAPGRLVDLPAEDVTDGVRLCLSH